MSNQVITMKEWIRTKAERAYPLVDKYPAWVDLTSIVSVIMPPATSVTTLRKIAEEVGWIECEILEGDSCRREREFYANLDQQHAAQHHELAGQVILQEKLDGARIPPPPVMKG